MTQANQKNRIALITGGSRGLGRSMALHLAAQGVGAILTYRAEKAEADKVVAQLHEKGVKAAALQLDVGDTHSFGPFAEAVKATLQRTFGRSTFDCLVNNGGHGHHGLFAETTEAQFDSLLQVHLKGPFFLTQKLLPLLEDGGSILNISSGLARFAFPGSSAYAVMKGGLEVLTRYLAKELGPRGISVNTLAPGAIETDFRGGAVRDNPELNKAIAAQTALGRVGLPDDIGAAAAQLLSPGCHWITGQRIEASGGMVL
jgi:NAD(P)-dependent dehydrogenase (short-subunit alcohol dehydrogenase family)